MISQTYSSRKYGIIGIIVLIGLVYLTRLFLLQVPKNSYKLSAENNILRYITEYPTRGLIFDRTGKLLVYNEPAYDLLVVPGQLSDFDTTELCGLLNIDPLDFSDKLSKAKKYSNYKPSIFLEQISQEDHAFLAEKLYKYPGFYVQARSLRKYPYNTAAHTLGYIGEVTKNEVESDVYYQSGDYIGKSGIEKFYEKALRGEKGLSIKIVDVYNREKGAFREGIYDTAAIAGKSIQITLDADLQKYGEYLMQNKIGSIVAIEPASGEILAFVTSPTYDPNLLVGRIRSKNYTILSKDSLKPLMHRAIMGTYSPGSTFKIVNALIGLQEQVLYPDTKYDCQGPNSRPIKCTHFHTTPLELQGAIMHSCNPYFWKVFRSIINKPTFENTEAAYNNWKNHANSLGFGLKFHTDIPFELRGNIPASDFYNRIYGEGRWNSLTIRSLAIGQGEILVTPLQMANFTAIVANYGYYYPPHLLKSIIDQKESNNNYRQKQTTINKKYFSLIVKAMNDVVDMPHGTAYWVRIPDIPVCGKTGTVENPHGKDHSTFIAFAPKDEPQIAIAVVVENAGYGSTWAAPIASLMIEKYITKEINRKWMEDRIANANLLNRNEEKK